MNLVFALYTGIHIGLPDMSKRTRFRSLLFCSSEVCPPVFNCYLILKTNTLGLILFQLFTDNKKYIIIVHLLDLFDKFIAFLPANAYIFRVFFILMLGL